MELFMRNAIVMLTIKSQSLPSSPLGHRDRTMDKHINSTKQLHTFLTGKTRGRPDCEILLKGKYGGSMYKGQGDREK
jgi:hypothetical protein